MERRKFDNYSELGNRMYELACEESQVVTAVLFCEEAVELVKWLMLYDDITVRNIDIESEDYHGYDKEFYITLDGDLVLNVTPAYSDSAECLSLESDIIFYGGDVSSHLAIQSIYGKKYEIVIKDSAYEGCSYCCEDCSTCPHRGTSENIANTLDLLDYIFNHYGEN